jgi:hypothetical protein
MMEQVVVVVVVVVVVGDGGDLTILNVVAEHHARNEARQQVGNARETCLFVHTLPAQSSLPLLPIMHATAHATHVC